MRTTFLTLMLAGMLCTTAAAQHTGTKSRFDGSAPTVQKAPEKKTQEKAKSKAGTPTVATALSKKAAAHADAIPQGKARVTVVNNVNWGDGSGYVLLLDQDADTYGDIIPINDNYPVSDYDEFEYVLPEGATYDNVDLNIQPGTTLSIDIEPGTYDFCLVNPSPEDGDYTYYIAMGEYGRQREFEFRAGGEYVLSIDKSGSHDNVTMTIKSDYDLGITNIMAENPARYNTTSPIVVEVTNVGNQSVAAGDYSVRLEYDNEVVEETGETQALAPGACAQYTFNFTWDELGSHSVSASISDHSAAKKM